MFFVFVRSRPRVATAEFADDSAIGSSMTNVALIVVPIVAVLFTMAVLFVSVYVTVRRHRRAVAVLALGTTMVLMLHTRATLASQRLTAGQMPTLIALPLLLLFFRFLPFVLIFHC